MKSRLDYCQNPRRLGALLSGAMLVATFVEGDPLYAQDTGTGDQSDAQTPAEVRGSVVSDSREIVVTAQRREENLQQVPISVVAFTGETLARSGVRDVSDLSTVTPGLVWSQSLSSSTPFIRGVGTTDGSAANESSIALYIDGQYYPSQQGSVQSLSNIERVEVLKGPQGTLFGRNATGGLIQIITRDPSETPTLEGRIGYANYDTFEMSAYGATGLATGVATDLSLHYINQQDGWGKIVGTDIDVHTRKSFVVRNKTRAEFGDSVTATLTLDYANRTGSQGIVRGLLPGATAVTGVHTFAGNIYDTTASPQPDARSRQGGVGLKVEVELPFARLISISGFRKVRDHLLIDQDITPVDFQVLDIKTRDRSFTEELQLVSTSDGKFEWIVGGFFMSRRSRYVPARIEGLSLPPPLGGGNDNFTQVDTRSLSAFAQGTYAVLPDTKVTVGVRYTSDRQDASGFFVTDSGLSGVYPDVSKTFKKVSWRFAVDQKLGEQSLLYASATRGFKAGLFNATNPAALPADPEVLDSYEAGVKTELFDRIARLNLSVFHYDYTDIQIQFVQGGFVQTINAGKAKLTGLDAEFMVRLMDGLTFRGNLSWLPKAEYSTFAPAPITVRNPAGGNIINPNGDASGNRMVRAPELTYSAAIDYTTDLGNDVRLDANVNWIHTSRFRWEPDNRVTQDPYGLLQAQVGLTFGNFDVRLWAKNITKSDYYVFVNQSAFGDSGVPGAPRTYGVSAGFKF